MTQLHDGRWVKMRELTSGEEIAATAAANVQMMNGQIQFDGQLRVAREKVKMALVAVTRPMPKRAPAPPPRAPTPPSQAQVKINFVIDNGDAPGSAPELPAPPAPAAPEEPPLPTDADWQPLSYSGLETSYDELFGPKERAQLAGLYDHIHSMIPMEDAVSFFANIRSVASST